MENLNLEAYGLVEMSFEEKEDADGGFHMLILGALLIDSMINSESYSQSLMDGWI